MKNAMKKVNDENKHIEKNELQN